MQVKSGVPQRADDVAVIGRPVETSTPMTAAAQPTTSRPAPSSSLPAGRRQLFRSTAEGVQTVQPTQDNGSKAAKQTEWIPQISIADYLKQFTSHFLYTLSILEGSKPTEDFVVVWRNLNDLACKIFGRHGSTPCLSPVCKNRRE